MNQVRNLTFAHFNTENPGAHLAHCESAFHLWEKQWSETFRELGANKEIYSDDFLNRELTGLFLGTEAIGFVLCTFIDLSRYSHRRLQYSHSHPETLWRVYSESQDQVMSTTYLTLDHDWRKSNTDYPISELIMGLSVLRFLESPADRLIGYFRNNRGVNEMMYRHGGTPVLVNQIAYNVPVDFIQITRENARLSDWKDCAQLTLDFWTRFKFKKTFNSPLNPNKETKHVVTLHQ
jgi:hypothetical protein